ncbi:hypothetical protein lerEdw1_009865 [Lerista edwardsae]|nr:hypothetical protein lerEdw1_009865 [Lerista edwardsae]
MILFPLLAALLAVASGLKLEGSIYNIPGGGQVGGSIQDGQANGFIRGVPGVQDQSGSVPVGEVGTLLNPVQSLLKLRKRSPDSDSDSVSSSEEDGPVAPQELPNIFLRRRKRCLRNLYPNQAEAVERDVERHVEKAKKRETNMGNTTKVVEREKERENK